MHRSGTSLVTGLLEAMGLFVGARQDENAEAQFFFRLNEWVLAQCGGAWDRPEVVGDLFRSENQWVRDLIVARLREKMSSLEAVRYLGPAKLLRYRSVAALDFPWGWKDPRTTLTLPLWLEIFPDARILHVFRHGVDVAVSIVSRAERQRGRATAQALKRWGRLDQATSLRCSSVAGAFDVYRSYMAHASTHVARLADRALEVKYEDFLQDPRAHLMEIAAFAGLEVNAGKVAALAEQVRPERAFAYRQDPALIEFAKLVGGDLASHGYAP